MEKKPEHENPEVATRWTDNLTNRKKIQYIENWMTREVETHREHSRNKSRRNRGKQNWIRNETWEKMREMKHKDLLITWRASQQETHTYTGSKAPMDEDTKQTQ